ncbi:hypothetical protein ACH4LE_32155 [Streptomyces sp. NPDC017413]|uniref:DUF7676 family protein n=1 Tax=Streptomyces sp. NPDC017413 TaxID=3364994 RepID=UPI0037BD85C2
MTLTAVVMTLCGAPRSLLPNPFLTDRQGIRDTPDFSRLAAWDGLRSRFLSLPADPLDRTGKGFAHNN